jgi:hypothetical protein
MLLQVDNNMACEKKECDLEKKDYSAEERAKMAESGAAMSGGQFPIVNATDLHNAIQSVGRAKDYEKAKAHIIARAKALGLTAKLPEDWVAKENDEVSSFGETMEVIKAFSQPRYDRRRREYRFIKSIVMTPGKLDKQNDWTDADEIEDAIHEFMMNLQKTQDQDESGISYRHSRLIKSNDAMIVECCKTDFPETWNGKEFPAGSWKVGIRVYDQSLFPEIDSGQLRGCSIEGSARHQEMPLQ